MPSFGEEEVRTAVAASLSYAEALRRLGLRPAGGNFRHLRRYVEEVWQICTDHFDPAAARAQAVAGRGRQLVPLEDVLVSGSRYSRRALKLRLYESGLKQRKCELCGQGELWRGSPMTLILDHVNGVADDNRLENLRIVCPNCNATLATHCGRNNRSTPDQRTCARCGVEFRPRRRSQRYCSSECGIRHDNRIREVQPGRQKVARPSLEQLRADLTTMSMVAVGRKYGVSDNAVRKWLRAYERSARAA